MIGRQQRRCAVVASAALVFAMAAMPAFGAPAGADRRLDELEARLRSDPASLRAAAEYRQLAIATGAYDRSIRLFEPLTRDPRGGANRFLNLALACVDKVPAVGTIKQAFLGRDIINATTRAIAIDPSPVAYFVRGLVNLYYDPSVRVDTTLRERFPDLTFDLPSIR